MMEQKKNEASAEPTLEPLLQAHIGKQLRNMYDAMAREPVPERFKLLLDRLEAGEEKVTTAHGKAAADKAGAV
jgi:hypothetical protein